LTHLFEIDASGRPYVHMPDIGARTRELSLSAIHVGMFIRKKKVEYRDLTYANHRRVESVRALKEPRRGSVRRLCKKPC
jgi:hypothetical protein